MQTAVLTSIFWPQSSVWLGPWVNQVWCYGVTNPPIPTGWSAKNRVKLPLLKPWNWLCDETAERRKTRTQLSLKTHRVCSESQNMHRTRNKKHFCERSIKIHERARIKEAQRSSLICKWEICIFLGRKLAISKWIIAYFEPSRSPQRAKPWRILHIFEPLSAENLRIFAVSQLLHA